MLCFLKVITKERVMMYLMKSQV
uniref:Uncharacterized protein n=1 Tax=Tetranychus urticae TaxID=32264 RepID=T1L489_TETUR